MPHGEGELQALALEAAQEGARAIRRSRGQHLEIQAKEEPGDFVTMVDRASEKAIISHIHERRPTDSILAEESGEHPGISGVRWLVDPLDGTLNFIRRREDYAVSVGAELHGHIIAGAIVRPAFDDWIAAEGATARGSSVSPAVSGVEKLPDAIVSMHLSHSQDRRAVGFELFKRLFPEVKDFRRSGSPACDLFSVAAGALDAYIGVQHHPWDIGAGIAIVQGAGGSCITVEAPSGYEILIAGTPAIARALVPIISSQ